jgi:hypothetical protein
MAGLLFALSGGRVKHQMKCVIRKGRLHRLQSASILLCSQNFNARNEMKMTKPKPAGDPELLKRIQEIIQFKGGGYNEPEVADIIENALVCGQAESLHLRLRADEA